MTRPLVMLCFGLLVGLFVTPGSAKAQGMRDKLSPRLRMVTSGRTELVESARRRLHLRTFPGNPEPMVDAFVRVKGNPKELEAYGVRVRSILGDVATVDIPLNALETIAGHPEVIRIEEARRLKPRLDVSVP
ncbi:MAG TPA: hypothetical protein VML36_09470, partial [Nitrospiria bacterium]|nr:hypothetical protein [Nitrospiria bacterium]